jgi:hypothetical protein
MATGNRKDPSGAPWQSERRQRRQLLAGLVAGGAGLCLASPGSADSRPATELGPLPSRFQGSDIQRVQAAFDFALENQLNTVYLDRTYDLTGGSIVLPSSDWAPAITFVGGGLTKRDDGYMFDRHSDNLATDSPKFQRVRFRGRDGATAVVSNGNRMIRQSFADFCDFRHVAAVHADHYTQSVRLLNCEMYYSAGTFLKAPRHYDLSCHDNRFETSTHSLLEAISDESSLWPLSVARFTNNCIEGYITRPPIRLSAAAALLFQGNYCEHNVTTLEFVQSRGMRQVSGLITANAFFETRGASDIDIGNVHCHHLAIAHNISNAPQGKSLVRRGTGNAPQLSNNYLYAGGSEILK